MQSGNVSGENEYFNMLVSGGGELHIAESKQNIHIYNF